MIRADKSALSTGSIVCLFVTVFFSVVLHEISAAIGWLSAVLADGSAGQREPVRRRVPPVGLVAPLLLFVVASAVSAAFGVAPANAWRPLRGEMLAIGLAAAGAGVLREAEARLAVAVFLGTAAVAGAWSVYQLIFEFGGAIDFSHRAYGFWHRTAFISYANVLAMALMLAVGLGFWGTGRLRGLAFVGGSLATVGMALSYTRASWLVSAVLLGVVSLRRRAVVPLVVIVLLAAAVLIVPATDDSRQFVARARSAFDPAAGANVDRLVRYRVGAAVIRDYPLLGTGPGALKVVYPRYALPGARENWHLHNTYLQLLAERGPLGLGAWLLAMVWGMVHTIRSSTRVDPDRKGLAIGVGLVLATMLLLGIFNYIWEDWRTRSLTLAFLGLAWSPAVTGDETVGKTGREVGGG